MPKSLDWIAGKLGYEVKRTNSHVQFFRKPRRGFDAGATGDIFADWTTTNRTLNEDLRSSLKKMRARSRDLAQNNDYMKKFLRMTRVNIIGPQGVHLQMKIQDSKGTLDNLANQLVESAWKHWGRMPNCTVTGDQTWLDLQKMVVETIARDGEVLIQRVRGFDNEFKYALMPLEADHLPEDLNKDLSNGHKIRMGVELDKWNRPVAYHLTGQHPGDGATLSVRNDVVRVPADQIIHLFVKERPGQVRGVPWAHSSMTRLQMIGGYEEAELVGARSSASKMGFFESEGGPGDYKGDGVDAAGNIISEFSPGTMEELPPGVTFKAFNPGNPSANFKDFLKTMLRGVASGLNVSYNTLGSDLEGVNFSSIRSGVLEERECWKDTQAWIIDHLHRVVFEEWLTMALTFQPTIPMPGTNAGLPFRLPLRKFNKFNAAHWQARGWAWVDPMKDVQANILAVEKGFKSVSDVVAEQGRDLEDVLTQKKADQALAEQMGVPLALATEPEPNSPAKEAKENDDDED